MLEFKATLNAIRAFRSREDISEYNKKYRLENFDKLSDYNKQYQKHYREDNRENYLEKKKQHYLNIRDEAKKW